MRMFGRSMLLVSCMVVSACGKSRPTNQEDPNSQLEPQVVGKTDPQSEPAVKAKAPADVGPEIAQAALEVIKGLQGKDLRKLGKEQVKELTRTISNLVPKRTYWGPFDFSPWSLWDFRKKEGPPLYLLLEADQGPHPGYTRIRLTLLDEFGSVTSETTFGTGWRFYLRDAVLMPGTKEQFPILVLETGNGAGPGPNVSKQYYAWIEKRFDLIRLEDSAGNATRNRYYLKHFQCGPAIAQQPKLMWESDLVSGDRLKLLRGLTWLGGSHWDLHADDKEDRQFEEFNNIRNVRNVRARTKVIARLKVLANSKDKWLREAAALALDAQDTRIEVP